MGFEKWITATQQRKKDDSSRPNVNSCVRFRMFIMDKNQTSVLTSLSTTKLDHIIVAITCSLVWMFEQDLRGSEARSACSRGNLVTPRLQDTRIYYIIPCDGPTCAYSSHTLLHCGASKGTDLLSPMILSLYLNSLHHQQQRKML